MNAVCCAASLCMPSKSVSQPDGSSMPIMLPHFPTGINRYKPRGPTKQFEQLVSRVTCMSHDSTCCQKMHLGPQQLSIQLKACSPVFSSVGSESRFLIMQTREWIHNISIALTRLCTEAVVEKS
jgi:hypothetical protein